MELNFFSRVYAATLRKLGLRKKYSHLPLRQEIFLRSISQTLDNLTQENKEFKLVAQREEDVFSSQCNWLRSLKSRKMEDDDKETLLPILEDDEPWSADEVEMKDVKKEVENQVEMKDVKKEVENQVEKKDVKKEVENQVEKKDENSNGENEEKLEEKIPENLAKLLPPGLRGKISVQNFFQDYSLTSKILGTGSHGKVFYCQHLQTKEFFAVKTMDCSIENLTSLELHLSLLPHKNIHHIEAIYVNQLVDDKFCPFLRYNMNLREGLYAIIVSKIMKGRDLFYQLVEENSIKTEAQIKNIMKKVLLGLCHIHSKNLVHGDIKLENIFGDEDDNFVIADFDFIQNANQIPNGDSSGFTMAYVSPEIIDNITCKRLRLPLSSITCASDMWALGVLFYVLLHRRFPFPESSPTITVDFSKRIMDAKFEVGKFVSNEAKHLLSLLLQRKPEFRPTAEQVLDHAFFKKEDV